MYRLPSLSGPSPSARGSRPAAHAGRGRCGSIPVCTGEPWGSTRRRGRGGVHPRLHGGASVAARALAALAGPSPSARGATAVHSSCSPSQGPSPSARGSPPGGVLADAADGSIPVCTGEPPGARALRRRAAVHPRLHGGAQERRPASRRGAVHPRLHGGAWADRDTLGLWAGPSPSARGSLEAIMGLMPSVRSIPVCTGEPPSPPGLPGGLTVHPRLHGGASCGMRRRPRRVGPSPSARGSQPVRRRGVGEPRSIPVCTGEPALGCA